MKVFLNGCQFPETEVSPETAAEALLDGELCGALTGAQRTHNKKAIAKAIWQAVQAERAACLGLVVMAETDHRSAVPGIRERWGEQAPRDIRVQSDDGLRTLGRGF